MPNSVKVNSAIISPLDPKQPPKDGTMIFDFDMIASIPKVSANPIPVNATFHMLGKVPGGPGLNIDVDDDITAVRLFKLRQNPKIVTTSASDPDQNGIVTIQLEIILYSKVPKQMWGYSTHDKVTKRIFTLTNPPASVSGQTDVIAMADPCSGDEDTKLDITIKLQVKGSKLIQAKPQYIPTKSRSKRK